MAVTLNTLHQLLTSTTGGTATMRSPTAIPTVDATEKTVSVAPL